MTLLQYTVPVFDKIHFNRTEEDYVTQGHSDSFQSSSPTAPHINCVPVHVYYMQYKVNKKTKKMSLHVIVFFNH